MYVRTTENEHRISRVSVSEALNNDLYNTCKYQCGHRRRFWGAARRAIFDNRPCIFHFLPHSTYNIWVFTSNILVKSKRVNAVDLSDHLPGNIDDTCCPGIHIIAAEALSSTVSPT